jgi:transcriptional regulator with XRE-family HTH domain
MTLGQRIKSHRTELKLRQKDVCRRTKLSAGFYSDLENDNREPSAATLHALSKCFGVTMDQLFTGKANR